MIEPHTPPCLSRSFQSLGLTTQLFPGHRKLFAYAIQSFCMLSASREPAMALALPHHEGTCASLDPISHDHKCPTKQGLCSLVSGLCSRTLPQWGAWCHMVQSDLRHLQGARSPGKEAYESELHLLCLFSFNYTGRLTVCPTSSCPMVTGLGRAGRYMIGKQNLCLTTY